MYPGVAQVRAVRRLIDDVWNLGHFELLTDLVVDDYVGHLPIGDHYGPQGMRIDIAAYRTALPDLVVTVDDLLTAADKVVRRYTVSGTHCRPFLGIPASGLSVALHAIAIDRLVDGKLAESWVQIDPVPAGNRR